MKPVSIDIQKIIQGDAEQLRLLFEPADPQSVPVPVPEPLLAEADKAIAAVFGPDWYHAENQDLAEQVESLVSRCMKALPATQREQFPALLRRLRFGIGVFLHILQATDLARDITDRLSGLMAPFLITALREDRVYTDRDHPLHRLINAACQAGLSWHPQAGKLGNAFPEQLATVVEQLGATGEENASDAIQRFSDFIHRETRRAKTAEQRYCESISGQARVEGIQQLVAEHINNSLCHSSLPESLIHFIRGPLREELQFSIINRGTDTALWKRWKSTLTTLGQTFAPDRELLDKQRLYRELPPIANFLERPVRTHSCAPEAYQAFAEQLSLTLLQVLKGEDFACETFIPIALERDSAIETHVSKSLLKRAEHLKEGDWFAFVNDQQQEIRCKLALKLADTDQLLFVNRQGHKALQKSSADFVVCLSSGIARPLSFTPPFELALPLALAEFIQRQRQADKDAQLAKAKVAEQQARIDREKKKAAAEKAKQEAALLQQRKAEADANAIPALGADVVQQTLDTLRIGTWVDIHPEGKEALHCKLAVLIAASGKFIFVDDIGLKVAEYQREDVARLIGNRQLTIAKQGKRFEDELAKVIRGLRKDG